MARLFKVLIVAGLALLSTAAVLYIIPSDQYILLPDRARPLAPQVLVRGERADGDGGGIYYVAVEVDRASILDKLFHRFREGATLVPESAVRAPDESEREHRKEELQAMVESQKIGAVVALRALGYRVPVTSPGTVIAAVSRDGPSAGKLSPGDVIVSVDGRPTPSLTELRRAIGRHRPGEVVRVKVSHRGATRTFEVTTTRDPENRDRPIIGIQASCALQAGTKIDLPVPVRIDLGQVGGPSAGLAFALDVTEELGHAVDDVTEELGHAVDDGRKVAATGELCLDGSVVDVGGLKQKTIGARRAGIDVFLVPADPLGENAKEARRYAGNMEVVPVNSFRQALQALATSSKKQANS